MVVADLVGVVDIIQLAYDKNVMKPAHIKDLETYAYCPILKIVPGVYARKAIIRVFIDNHISMGDMRRIKRRFMQGGI